MQFIECNVIFQFLEKKNIEVKKNIKIFFLLKKRGKKNNSRCSLLAAGKMSIFRGGENFFRRNFLPLQLYKWINLLRENSFGKNSRSLRSIYTKSTSVCSSRIPSPFDILIVVHIFPFFSPLPFLFFFLSHVVQPFFRSTSIHPI